MRKTAVVALTVAVVLSGLLISGRPTAVLGQTYSLVQNDWSGGASGATASGPDNLSGYNKYASANGVTAGAGSVTLTPAQSTFTESFGGTTYKDSSATTADWSTSGQLSKAAVPDYSFADLTSGRDAAGLNRSQVLAKDAANGAVYIGSGFDNGGNNITFGKYGIAANSFSNLTVSSGFSSFWTNDPMTAMVVDGGKVYMGGWYGTFAVYDAGTGSAANLTTSSGLSSVLGQIVSLTADSVNHKIYIGGTNGQFAVYDEGTGLAASLSAKISGFWASDNIQSGAYNPADGKIYIGGYAGKFGVYDPGTDTAVNLTTTSGLSAFWGTASVLSMIFCPLDNRVYLLGYNSSNQTRFAAYAAGSPGTATNIVTTSGLSPSYASVDPDTMAFDSVGNKIYIGAYGYVLSYSVGVAGSVQDLTGSITALHDMVYGGGVPVLQMDSSSGKLFGSVSYGGLFALSINQSQTTASNLSAAMTGLLGGNGWMTSSIYCPADNKIYIGATDTRFFRYDPATGSATDISVSSGLFGVWGGYREVDSMLYDSVSGKLYLAGGRGNFSVYTPGSPSSVVNLAVDSGLSAFWGENNVYQMVLDSANRRIYLGGTSGLLAVYSIGSPGTATNLTTTSGLSAFWGTDYYNSSINAMGFDPVRDQVYLGGTGGKFAVYTPGAPGAAADLASSSGLSAFWYGDVSSIVFDSVNQKMYVGGGYGNLAVYAPGSPGVATDLHDSSGLSGFFTNGIYSMAFDAANVKLYIAGEYGSLAVYSPGSPGTAANLAVSSGYSSIGGQQGFNRLSLDQAGGKLYFNDGNCLISLNIISSSRAVSLSADSTLQNIQSVTLTKHDTVGSGSIMYLVSNDGGATYGAVTPGTLYSFSSSGSDLRFKILLDGNATVQDVTLAYNYFPVSGELISSKFDAVDPTNIVNQIAWDENQSLPSGTGVTVSIRTAATSAGLDSAPWVNFKNGQPGSVPSTVTESFDTTTNKDSTTTTAAWSGSGQLSAGAYAGHDLTSVLAGAGITSTFFRLAVDQSHQVIYLAGGSGEFVSYAIASGAVSNLATSSGLVGFWGTSAIADMAMDQGKVYLLSTNSKFAVYDPVTGQATDLNNTLGGNPASMAVDTDTGIIYIGQDHGGFGSYDPAGPSYANLTVSSGLSVFWGAGYYDQINTMAYDGAGKIYMGSGNNDFAYYSVASGTATDRTSVLSSVWPTGSIDAMVYNSVDGKLYMSGRSPLKFVSYAPGTPGVATDLTVSSGLSGVASSVTSMAHDAEGKRIFLGYYQGAAAYNIASNTVTVLSGGDAYIDYYVYGLALASAGTQLYTDVTSSHFGYYSLPCLSCVAASATLDSVSQNIYSATLTKNDTPGSGTVAYQLTNDGGVHWSDVTPGSPYYFTTTGSDLRFKISFSGDATIQDVSVTYYSASPDTSASCAKATTTVTCAPASVPSSFQDGSGDRWFQYKIELSSDGTNAPTVTSAAVQFVVNAAPEVRNVTAAQNADGTVTIHYETRDIDTAGGSAGNRFHVTPHFEYWNGTTYQTISALAAGDSDQVPVAHDGSWDNVVHAATWTPATDFPGHFMSNTAKIRVTANDGEGANPTGSAESPVFSLDTKIPAAASLTVDASAATPTAHLSETEDNPGTMKVSATDPTLASTSAEAYAATKALPSLAEGNTVYAKLTDAYSNSTNIMSATVPMTPTSVIIQDISNVVAVPNTFRLFVAWKATTGAFASYRIHRSTTAASPETWPQIASIPTQSTNYYVDNDVNQGDSLYYYITGVDGAGNISFRSSVVHATANGTQDIGEGGGGTTVAPTISNVSSGTPRSTQATVTWDTDTLSNSVVEYSTTPSTFTSSVTVGSLVNNAGGVGAHSVVVSGLRPSTAYYFRVKSTDIANQTTVADNGGAGYMLTTPVGPVISNASVEQTTNTAARVSWLTDILATTQMVHSVHADMSAPTVTTGTSDPTTAHAVTVTNLNPGTTYYFYVRSVDQSSNESVDDHVVDGVPQYYSFTTTNDTTPPVISDVSVRTGANSADIIWTTNEPADSQVEYGTTTSYGTTTALDSTATTRHVVTITGLQPQTAYDYRIRTRDANSVLAIGDNLTFSTTIAGDATPPAISNAFISSLSLNAAAINWNTDEAASSYVDYGTTTALGSTRGTDGLAVGHSVALPGLLGNTKYYYRLRSADAAGNSAADDNGRAFYSFTTAADATEPVVSGLDDIVLMNSFRVIWTTDELADSQVEYGPTDSYGTSTALDSALVIDHSVTVSSLSAAATYHYRIKTRDASGNLMTGLDHVVTTSAQADHTPPVITGPSVSGISRTAATVTWTTDEKSGSEVQYGPNTTYGYSASNINDNLTSHSVALAGLVPGQKYYFKVISADGSGNIASDDNAGAGYSFTAVVDATPPVISAVGTQLVADTSVVISWKTDEPANSQVIYGTSVSYGSQTVADPTLSTYHSAVITGLTAATQYFYKVVSADAYANSATDDNQAAGYSFTTSTGPVTQIISSRRPEVDTTPPIIMNLQVNSIGKNEATVEWMTDEPANGVVKYGVAIAYGTLGGSIDERVSSHKVFLNGLKSGTIYHFIAVSSDASGNQGTTADRVFATLNEDGTAVPVPNQPTEMPANANAPAASEEAPAQAPKDPIEIAMSALQDIVKSLLANAKDQQSTQAFGDTVNELANRLIQPPAIVGSKPTVEINGATAIVHWATDRKSSGAVAYVAEASYSATAADPYPSVVSNRDEMSTDHFVTLLNLEPATTYHFQVRSKGAVGGEAHSSDATFVTASDLPVITDISLSDIVDSAATVKWKTNVPTSSSIEYSDIATGANLTQGDKALLRDHQLVLNKLSSGVTYKVTVVAADEQGNKAQSKPFFISTSKDTKPPALSKVSSDSTLYPGKDTRVQTIISWTTDEPSTSHVFYQEGLAKDAPQIDVAEDQTMVTSHTVVITRFRPATVYKFHVESVDPAGNAAKSNDFLILTPQQKASVLDVIIGNFEQVFGWTKKLR